MRPEQDYMKDKSLWGPGPWQDEPDYLEWIDPTTRLPCMMKRGTMGSWCGYVGLPYGHRGRRLVFESTHRLDPKLIKYLQSQKEDAIDKEMIKWYGGKRKEPGYDRLDFISVHGGLTFSSMGVDLLGHKNLALVGFDCAHFDDRSPVMDAIRKEMYAEKSDILGEYKALGGVYRDVAYVRQEVGDLAAQLHIMPCKRELKKGWYGHGLLYVHR